MASGTADALGAREELKTFLRARRAELAPEMVGLSRGRRRLTPGLRREEVAQLAGVGLTWYTWLEQGREIRASAAVLDRIAGALRLSQSDKIYLFALAGHPQPFPSDEQSELPAAITLALNSIEASPALVVNPRFDIIASNALAHSILELDAGESPFSKNLFWRAFVDQSWRVESSVRVDRLKASVGVLRANYASRIGDPHFEELLEALRAASQDFAQAWDDCRTESLAPKSIRFESRKLGDLNVWGTGFAIPDHPGFLMLVYPPADAETTRIFNREAAKCASLNNRVGTD
ncbi:MAG TPA: helix-turn-helix transcriptional regulator [Allosphingosinicella sp.]|nr:helix-turn-helix transcriptional regulator [Allosphingosinicella sp.]